MTKDLNVGDVSGCLEVISDYKALENEIQEIISQWAEIMWKSVRQQQNEM